MALPGELKGLDGTICEGCGGSLSLGVQRSGAGWYLGYWCYLCGPISRETSYFTSREEAKIALDKWLADRKEPENLRNTKYTGAVHNPNCFICTDPYFAAMGLPLCRRCPKCGGHIAADDSVCDSCGYDEYEHYGEEEIRDELTK